MLAPVLLVVLYGCLGYTAAVPVTHQSGIARRIFKKRTGGGAWGGDVFRCVCKPGKVTIVCVQYTTARQNPGHGKTPDTSVSRNDTELFP